MCRRLTGQLLPTHLSIVIVNDRAHIHRQKFELLIIHVAERTQYEIVGCHCVAQCHSKQRLVLLQILYLIGSLDDLSVRVLQQKVEIVQRGRILVFEAVEKFLLYYAQLVRPVLQRLAKAEDLATIGKVLIYGLQQVQCRYLGL